MRRTASILLAGALAVAALATTEGEDLSAHPCYDEATETLVFPEQQVWFHEGESKLGNAAATPNPFDTTAPAASVTDGAGAGQYGAAATSTSGTEAYGAVETTFSGTFTGCLDTILLDVAQHGLGHQATIDVPLELLADQIVLQHPETRAG